MQKIKVFTFLRNFFSYVIFNFSYRKFTYYNNCFQKSYKNTNERFEAYDHSEGEKLKIRKVHLAPRNTIYILFILLLFIY